MLVITAKEVITQCTCLIKQTLVVLKFETFNLQKNSVYLPNRAKHLTQSINIPTSFEIRCRALSK